MTIEPSTTNPAKLDIVNPPGVFDPSPFGYSQATVSPPGSRLAFVSGQGGADERGALPPDFEAQVEQAFGNLRAVLRGIGTSPDRVAKLTLFVVDHEPSKLGILTRAVVETFGQTLPAQTLIAVPRLALDGMLFEVEALAVVD